MTIFEQLRAEFPRNAISWRAQSVTKAGDKAMALAYIDARDVMNRLDEVCSPSDWQDRYEVHGAKTICYLSVRVDGEWITKADGAGDTDVEAEKGSISDAFKRAAVKWGIGRYLYDLEAPWVPCDSYPTTRGGKEVHVWKAWKADPWSFIRNSSSAPQQGRNAAGASPHSASSRTAPAATLSEADQDTLVSATKSAGKLCADPDTLRSWWSDQVPRVKPNLSPERFDALKQWVVDQSHTYARAA